MATADVASISVGSETGSQALTDLFDIISNLEAPGTYACGGQLQSILPGK
jgi:hypothetical protein